MELVFLRLLQLWLAKSTIESSLRASFDIKVFIGGGGLAFTWWR